jgi:hypothetical protein
MNLITEWRFSPIKGYEDYIICDDGTAYNHDKKRELRH